MANKTLTTEPSKLFQTLQKLSTPQLTKLRKLIESPYFHQTAGVTDLFLHLRKFHPDYPAQKVSDEAIAQQLFPKINNGAKKVKNFKTDLMKLVEQFLILQEFSQQEHQPSFLLAQAYQGLQLPGYANNSIKKLAQSLEQSTTRGLPHHYLKMQMAHFEYYHPDTAKNFKNQQKLQDLLNQLDQYFISAKYKYAHEALERMAKQKEEFDLRFWEEVQMEAPHFGGLDKQSPIYYYQQLQDLAAQDYVQEKSFEKLKSDFFENLQHLYQEDQQAIFKYLVNYITKPLNSGASQLTKLQFDLFKDGLSNNLVIWKNRISINSFINIVVIAAKCNDFAWIENFISTYHDYLNPDHLEDVMTITKALIAFHQQRPNQALSIIGSAKFKSPNLELFCLPLSVKCMFEIYLQEESYHSIITSRLDSLVKQFSSKYENKGYLNYVRFVQSLVNFRKNKKNNATTIKNIRAKISSTDRLIHKSWLLEKCDQMK